MTGNGDSCGDYCTGVYGKGNSDDDKITLKIDTIIIVAIVPLSIIACMVVLFYFANRSIDDKFAHDPALVGYAEEDEDEEDEGDFFDEERAGGGRKNLSFSSQDGRNSKLS